MIILEKIKNVNWIATVTFYILACGLTYLLIQAPNLIKEVWGTLLDFTPNFSWNHGIALFIVSLVAYRFSKFERKTTFLGNNPYYSLIFAVIFLVAYSVIGFSNDYGLNRHLWAFIFCLSTLVYDIFEETAWRGFLNDRLRPIPIWLKGIITGILWSFWHILIFQNFDQFGGFHIFLALSVFVSILMSYATERTNSILVASSIHALLILRDINVTIICAVLWIVMLTIWKLNSNKKLAAKFTD
jgi:hypothetical protein